ncbi:MAG: hypothetical protein E4H20_10970 [Spirochaetales bacterium]|nr:MAG: hypothetical protein E4H20_10970 [Spirochaetales bacterium]
MKRIIPALVAVAVLLASCVSQPAPASSAPAASSGQAATDTNQAYKDRAAALVQGTSGTSTAAGATASSSGSTVTATGTTDVVDVPPPPPGVLTPEEEAYLTNYLARLQYMVYFDEGAGLDIKLAKTAVNQANRFLIEKLGLNVVDFDQIEKNKKDQLTAYQAETGGSIDLMQYLAQKYNADVYVEIAFSASNSMANGKYYATAQGSMKLYDTSTAQLLGSVAFQSPQVMSTVSMDAVVSNAISASVWNAMPKMTEQSKSLVKGSLSRGVRYEVIIQNTPDSRAISTLRRALARNVREVEQVSYSASETKIYVYTFKSADKVEDALYDAAERAGMSDIYLVFSRGKAFTFNSGL